jgi:uncharacterized membrane protein (UPF0136 family)
MADRSGLLTAHRVLIGMAIALSVLVLAHGIALYVRQRDVASLVTGLVAVPVGLGLALYLHWFLRKQQR